MSTTTHTVEDESDIDYMPGTCRCCGSIDNSEEITGGYDTYDILLGDVRVPDIKFWACLNCGTPISIWAGEANRVNTWIDACTSDLIDRLPIGSFVTEPEALKQLPESYSKKYHHFRLITNMLAGKRFFYQPSIDLFLKSLLSDDAETRCNFGRMNLYDELKRLGVRA
jgi:hypothetical protein